MKKYIFVTGGAGYIGSNICSQLWESGFTPVVIDDLSTGYIQNVKFGPLEKCDIGDADRFAHLLLTYKPTVVIHAAGSIVVPESQTDPAKYYDNNVIKPMRMLETMRSLGHRDIIFSSTAAVYGNNSSELTEESDPRPESVYGHTKLTFENILKSYSAAYGFNCLAFRYFNAAGASLKYGLGPLRKPYTHLISSAIANCLDDKPIQIFGSDFPTDDGTQLRDYVHVTDIARAHAIAVSKFDCFKGFDVLNLSSGTSTSVRSVVDEVLKQMKPVCESECAFVVQPPRLGDPVKLVASNLKAKDVLGWGPSSNISCIVNDVKSFLLMQGER